MLSKYEYQDILSKLNNIQSSITGNSHQHLRITLRNKIHEHDIASHYPPFQPLNPKPFLLIIELLNKHYLNLLKLQITQSYLS